MTDTAPALFEPDALEPLPPLDWLRSEWLTRSDTEYLEQLARGRVPCDLVEAAWETLSIRHRLDAALRYAARPLPKKG